MKRHVDFNFSFFFPTFYVSWLSSSSLNTSNWFISRINISGAAEIIKTFSHSRIQYILMSRQLSRLYDLLRQTTRNRGIKFSRHKMWFAPKMCAKCYENWFCCGEVGETSECSNNETQFTRKNFDGTQYFSAVNKHGRKFSSEKLSCILPTGGRINGVESFQLFHYNPHDIRLLSLFQTHIMHKRWSVIIKFSTISFSGPDMREDKLDCWNMLI